MKRNMKKIIFITAYSILTILQSNAQKRLGIHAAYGMPTSNIKPDKGPFLFLKDMKSVGLDYNFVLKNKVSGFKFSADYLMGTNDKESIAAYAKSNDIPFTSYEFTKANPTGISLMAGPNFLLFRKIKKLPPIWLDLQAGAIVSNQQNLEFKNKNSITPLLKDNVQPAGLVYNPSIIMNLVRTKNILLNLRAGYSNVGGITLGVNIVSSCCGTGGCYCMKGCPEWPACVPKPEPEVKKPVKK